MFDKLFKIESILDISQTIATNIFSKLTYPWEVIPLINNFILEFSKNLSKAEYKELKPNVWVSKNAYVADSALINGPAIIQEHAEIRHCAFIRGNVVVGKNSVIGNSTELKNSILFNNVQAPHYNYIGDSILGYKSHLGAGAIISNVRSDKNNISVLYNNHKIATNLRKFGAIIGDSSEIGCNAVLNPGTILGKNVTVYPTSMVRGVIKENHIFKNDGNIIQKF